MVNKDQLLQQYLDGELSPEEEKQALHTIAEDEELRSMLRFEQNFKEVFVGEPLVFDPKTVPGDFSARVMHELEISENEQSH